MIRYYHTTDIRAADQIAVEKYGVPSLDLMENAGGNAASLILASYPDAQVFLVLAGPGNNGGDGFVAARHLCEAGKKVRVITSAAQDKYKNDALINLQRILNCYSNCEIMLSCDIADNDLLSMMRQSDLLIDALLGTGSNGAPRGETLRLVCAASASKVNSTVSLDIPSGIDPEDGTAFVPAIKADMTVTFLAPKVGMANSPAKELCGLIRVASIGISPDLVLDGKDYVECYSKSDISDLLPDFGRGIHKGSRGGVLIYGGSMNYRGAPILSALGAFRSGAGLVVLAVPDFMVDMASILLPEAVFLPLKTENGCVVSDCAVRELSPWLSRCNSVVFGPGSGRDISVREVLSFFLKSVHLPILIDADGLFHLSQITEPVYRKDAVITPHVGEAARLLCTDVSDVSANRSSSVRRLTKFGGTALLKGMGTLVFDGSTMRQVLEGSPALAVPGSGDVLSGAIGAFLAAGLTPADAAIIGATAHACAGSKIEKHFGINGNLAREIADELRNVLKR